MSKRALLTGVFAAAAFVLFAGLFLRFMESKANAAVDQNPEKKKPVVFARTIQLTELNEVLNYPARVEPSIRASINADADGVVTKIIAPLGSAVRAGAALLVIKNTDPVYQYAPMRVTTPVAGVVSHVEVTEGSRVSRGDKLALVTDPDQVRVMIELTAEDLRLVRPGMQAELKVPGSSVAPVTLKVRGVSPFVDPSTGTAACELQLAAKGAQLPPPGVIARVSFKANLRQGISITDSALTYRGKDPFVRVVENGKAKLVPVMLGRKQAGYVEILKGLKAGDALVERTSKFVAEGEEVEVEKPKEEPADSKVPAKEKAASNAAATGTT